MRASAAVAALALALAAAVALAAPAAASGPTAKDAAGYARWLVQELSVGSMATFDDTGDGFAGYPFVAEEDVAQDGALSGGLRFVFPGMSASYNNILADGRGSFSLARRNCSMANSAGLPFDTLQCERVTFTGDFVVQNVTVAWPTDNADVRQYAATHPALVQYLVQGTVHTWYLVEMDVKAIYWGGGYGSLHYLGAVPVDLYKAAVPTPPL